MFVISKGATHLNKPRTLLFLKKSRMKKILILLTAFFAGNSLMAQDAVYETFKDRWVINTPSVETLPKRKLDVRIGHRFGDFAGDAGGWPSFYGLENAADVAIGAEYGATNNLTLGLNRTKGAGALTRLVNGYAKYRVLQQDESKTPLSLAVFGLTSISTMDESEDPSAINFFEVFAHRVVNHVSVIAARKFSDRFSLQINAGATHRNVVTNGGENTIPHAGLATRIQVSKTLGIIGDLAVPFFDEDNRYLPFGIGFEFDTGGHVFQMNITNARGMMPTDYIPYTDSNWGDGEYRLGFTISRMFNL